MPKTSGARTCFWAPRLYPKDFMSDDPCCYLCRSAFGPCLTQRRCEHHIKAERQANADARRPIRDPTGNTAVNNVMREKRRQERN